MSMNTTRLVCWTRLIASVSCCLCVNSALAQFDSLAGGGRPGTVSGTGTFSIEKPPEVMRMRIDLLAKAGSLKDSLKALGARKEAARKTLERLGAEMNSISFGETSISNAQSAQQQQLSQMMEAIQEQRGRLGTPNAKAAAVPVTVSCRLSVEWKLKFETSEELLLLVHPLQQEIRDADLSGSKDVSTLTAEQQEMLEEMQGEYGYSYGYNSGEEEPGTPKFTFAAAVSEEEQDQALAAAFQRAKTEAARLSKATGAQLGKLVSVSSTSSSGMEEDYSYYQLPYYYEEPLTQEGPESDGADEATGLMPGKVKKRFAVTAWFDFKE